MLKNLVGFAMNLCFDGAFLMLEGIGITEILNAIVERIPPPQDTADRPLRALIFDR